MLRPLKGVRVIEFGMATAGPSCGKLLSELGAEVIVVESVGGRTTRWVTDYYDLWDTGKKSVCINVKTEDGMAAMRRLLRTADVFFSNFRMKALERLGLDYEHVRKIRQDIIYGVLTGWGEFGADADRPGFDPVCWWAHGGFMNDLAAEGTTVVPPLGMADSFTGQNLAAELTAALYKRKKTGKGSRIIVSLYGEAVFLNNYNIIGAQLGRLPEKDRTKAHSAADNIYPCRDGWIYLFLADDEIFAKAAGMLSLDRSRWPDLASVTGENAPEAISQLDVVLAEMTAAEAVRLLTDAGAIAERCCGTEEMMQDKAAWDEQFLFTWKMSQGDRQGEERTIVSSPLRFDGEGYTREEFERAPYLAEHTQTVLSSIGYTEQQLRELEERGCIEINRRA